MTQPDYTPVGRPKTRTGSPVLAVGWPLGFEAAVESGEVRDAPYVVARGGRYLDLPADAYRVWLMALGGTSRKELIEAVEAGGITDAGDADEIVSGLLRANAVVELDDDPLANAEILEHLRLCRVGIGLGNSVEQPNAFKIGAAGGGVRVVVDSRVYGVWGMSDGSVSIAEACRRLAKNVSDPDDPIEPSFVVGQIAVNLGLLLREGVALLDLHGE